ncbi:MAG: hypothetical protein KAJ10_05270 [Thermodesulfovibrionia bacterium]|nr:hypothetical protein [Thermodesulfovibrionia bacterium]
MADKINIKVGDRIIVKDGSHENMFIKSGVVTQLSEIAGTEYMRIHLDTPAIIDVERD